MTKLKNTIIRKLIVTVLIIIFVLSIVNAQITKVGGGLSLSSGFPFDGQTASINKSGIIALSFRHIHEISGPLQISPSFTIFYPHITKNQFDKTTVSSMMFDINVHYVFNSLDRFEFYGLAGPDLLIAWKKDAYEGSATYKEKNRTLGLNLGVGTYVKITEQFDIYGEAKYIFSKYDQFMLNVGILLNIDWMKKHENSDI